MFKSLAIRNLLSVTVCENPIVGVETLTPHIVGAFVVELVPKVVFHEFQRLSRVAVDFRCVGCSHDSDSIIRIWQYCQPLHG